MSVRPRALFVTHNVSASGNLGGVEVYLDALLRRLRADFEIFTYTFDQRSANAYLLYDEDGAELERAVFDGTYQRTSIANAAKEQYFAALLAAHRIELVHFHHLLGHPLRLPLVARACGVPALATLQDFWLVSDSYNLLDDGARYCDVAHRDPSICEPCTERRIGRPPDTQHVRRGFVRRSLAALDRIVFNSESSRAIVAAIYPELAASAKVAVLPLPLLEPAAAAAPNSAGRAPLAQRPSSEPLRVASIGNFTLEKGAAAFVAAAASVRDEPIEFAVHGGVQPRAAELLAQARLPNVRVAGGYALGDLPRILGGADITCHLSVWPETYCMALSEAWAHGCVPVVTALGALGERVTDGVNGFVVPPNDAAALAAKLRWIVRNRAAVDAIRANVTPALWLGEDAHAAVLRGWYRELLATPRTVAGAPRTVAGAPDAAPSARVAAEIENAGADATRLVGVLTARARAAGDGALLDTTLAVEESAQQFHVDEVCGVTTPCEVGVARAGTLSFTGWVAPRPDAQAVWVLLERDDDGSRALVGVGARERPDVAAFLDDPRALRCGFHGGVRAARLRPGVYRARVAQQSPAALHATSEFARIRIADD